MQTFKRVISRALVRLKPDVLVTSSGDLTPSDYIGVRRAKMSLDYLFLHGKRLTALAIRKRKHRICCGIATLVQTSP